VVPAGLYQRQGTELLPNLDQDDPRNHVGHGINPPLSMACGPVWGKQRTYPICTTKKPRSVRSSRALRGGPGNLDSRLGGIAGF
jgi:hypothetical protein